MSAAISNRRRRGSSFAIHFGLAQSFLPYNENGWNIIIENLCLYEDQNMDGILGCPVSRVVRLNEGAVNKAKILARIRNKKRS